MTEFSVTMQNRPFNLTNLRKSSSSADHSNALIQTIQVSLVSGYANYIVHNRDVFACHVKR